MRPDAQHTQLEELNIVVGHRRLLLTAIAKMKALSPEAREDERASRDSGRNCLRFAMPADLSMSWWLSGCDSELLGYIWLGCQGGSVAG